MARDSVDRLQQAVDAFLVRRRTLEARERALVASLEKALRPLGYTIVPVSPTSAAPGGRRTPRRRGRR